MSYIFIMKISDLSNHMSLSPLYNYACFIIPFVFPLKVALKSFCFVVLWLCLPASMFPWKLAIVTATQGVCKILKKNLTASPWGMVASLFCVMSSLCLFQTVWSVIHLSASLTKCPLWSACSYFLQVFIDPLFLFWKVLQAYGLVLLSYRVTFS